MLGFNQSDLDDFNDLGNRDDLRRHILRMGAVGSEEWIQFEKDLKKDADKMHTASSRTRELDKKIKHYEKAKQHLQDDRDQLPDYQSAKALEDQNRAELQEIRQQISQLSKQTSHQQKLLDAWSNYQKITTLQQQQTELTNQLAELQENNSVDLGSVEPMDSATLKQVKQLLQEQAQAAAKVNQLRSVPSRQTASTNKSTNGNLIWGVGVVLAAVDFFLPVNAIIKLILLAVIILGAYAVVKQVDQPAQPADNATDDLQTAETNGRKIDEKLRQIGGQTGFDVVPATEWVFLQNEVVSYQQLGQRLAELKQRQAVLREKLADFWQTAKPILQIDEAQPQPSLNELTKWVTERIQQIQQQQSQVQTQKILTQNLAEQQAELKQLRTKFAQFAIPPLDDHFDEWLAQLTETQKQAVRLRDLEKTVDPAIQTELQKYPELTELQAQQSKLTAELQQLKAQEQALVDERGTLEQLYISIRFAFMQAFADTVDLPIIIDDAFVAFDDQRLAETFGLLKQIAQQTQIIYFSAKKEVYQLVDQRNVVDLNEK